MYDAVIDSYCYEGTTVLKNIPDIHDQAALDAFEAAMTTERSDEPLPEGTLDVAHYYAIHRHLFQDIYPPEKNENPIRHPGGVLDTQTETGQKRGQTRYISEKCGLIWLLEQDLNLLENWRPRASASARPSREILPSCKTTSWSLQGIS